jgi:predicted transcriptional regulator
MLIQCLQNMRLRLVSKVTILTAISENRTFDIFKSIGSVHSSSDILITQLKLSRRQYYTRISQLTKTGLVKRQKGRYLLTAFGKVIYNAKINFEAKIENALNNYWKLKAIDSLRMNSREECDNIISVLIDNQEIRSVLMDEEPHLSAQAVNNKIRDAKDTLLKVPTYP